MFTIKNGPNTFKVIPSDTDLYNKGNVLYDKTYIIQESDLTTNILNVGTQYTVGSKELEVYVNGILMTPITFSGENAIGDYIESSNTTVEFQSGLLSENGIVRFRITSSSFDYSNVNSLDLQQLSKDLYGNRSSSLLNHSGNSIVNNRIYVSTYGKVKNDETIKNCLSSINSDDLYSLVLDKGTWNIANDTTVGDNVDLIFMKGAVLNVASSKELVLECSIEAGNSKIFDGDGSVKIRGPISSSKLEWWGAEINKSIDCKDAWNKWLDSEASCLQLNDGTYSFSELKIITSNVNIIGSGRGVTEIKDIGDSTSAFFEISPSFPGRNITIYDLTINGNVSSNIAGRHTMHIHDTYNADVHLSNIEIKNSSDCGLFIGPGGFSGQYEDVLIHDCAYDYGLYLYGETSNRSNANRMYNIRVLDCKGGIMVDNCQSNIIHAQVENENTGGELELLKEQNASAFNTYIFYGEQYSKTPDSGYLVDLNGSSQPDLSLKALNTNVNCTYMIRLNKVLGANIHDSRISVSSTASSVTAIIALTGDGVSSDGAGVSVVHNRISKVGSSTPYGILLTGIYSELTFNNYFSAGFATDHRYNFGIADDNKNIALIDLGKFISIGGSVDRTAFSARLDTDSYDRIIITNDGVIYFGSGTIDHDTKLYRLSSGVISSLGKITADQGLGVGNTVSNTNTPSGATTRAMPIYNASGTLLGYIPIYGTTW